MCRSVQRTSFLPSFLPSITTTTRGICQLDVNRSLLWGARWNNRCCSFSRDLVDRRPPTGLKLCDHVFLNPWATRMPNLCTNSPLHTHKSLMFLSKTSIFSRMLKLSFHYNKKWTENQFSPIRYRTDRSMRSCSGDDVTLFPLSRLVLMLMKSLQLLCSAEWPDIWHLTTGHYRSHASSNWCINLTCRCLSLCLLASVIICFP